MSNEKTYDTDSITFEKTRIEDLIKAEIEAVALKLTSTYNSIETDDNIFNKVKSFKTMLDIVKYRT